MHIKTPNLVIFLVILVVLLFCLFRFSDAQTVDELQGRIEDRNSAIQQLEQEIKSYQSQIDVISKEKDSLSNVIKTLDISKKKLEADTRLTENKIAAKNAEIKELSSQIGDKSERIIDSKRVISQSLYNISQMNEAGALEILLGKKSFSDLWTGADELTTLQGSMQERIGELKNLKTNLETNKKQTEQKKAELVELQNDLKNQAKVIAETVKEKNSILAETKNTEAGYKKLLATKEAQKVAFEQEITALENAIKVVIDPSSVPNTGAGVLKWPLDSVRITQYFGNTAYSTKNPQVYKGAGHTGIDFAASIGTPVKSASTGVVSHVVVANTKGCGYGKWIMVKHPSGISTLYAHLSLITAEVGDTVVTGQIIGYSGNTGFTTGPHLHFGVYVTEGFKTSKSVSCPGVTIPYTAQSGYLNPLSYLP